MADWTCRSGLHVNPERTNGGSCKPCRLLYNKKYTAEYRKLHADWNSRWYKQKRDQDPKGTWLYQTWASCKERAKKKAIPWQKHDLFLPEVCPALGLSLVYTRGRGRQFADSPSFDRIVPELGYVPGNVVVISYRANAMKQDSSLKELEALYFWRKSLEVASI